MANVVTIKRSNTLSAVPGALVDGEIAINQRDKVLFYRDHTGAVQQMSLVPVGGSVAVTTIEKDLGTKARAGKFQISGLSGLTPGKQIVITQAAGPYTGKGTLADEAERDLITVTGYVLNSTTIQCYWTCRTWVHNNFKFNYFIQS